MRMLAQKVDTSSWFLDHGVPILAIVVVALVATLVSRLLVRRFRRRLEGSPSLTQELNLQRAATLADALLAAVVLATWVIALMLVLGELSVNLAPLLASAGVAGVALGFGAQSLVRDTLSGFFILLENQFGVGDTLEAFTTGGVVSGRVEALTLRITTLRAFDGSLHMIPNGNIQLVSNKSRGWARAIVDVRVAYGEDLERVRGILEELFEEIRNDEVLHDWVMDGPSVLGIETLADSGQVIRVVADTRPSKRFDTERALRERILRRLAERDVTVPIPTVVPRVGPATGP
ncbi:MAG TPA: mechanosensitive ion channel family protein [Actinomycetota bacterium]|nr:mechanosensitive ion channel family protein [Actinomycetota bacterium]